MSWKSLTCVTMFCALLAGQAMAQPSLDVQLANTGGTPTLDSQGRLTWNIGVDVDPSLFQTTNDGFGSATAFDVGFTLTGMTAVSAAAVASNFDTNTPGHSVFGDETADEDGDYIGVQLGSDASNVFASLGSIVFTTGGLKEAATITLEPLSTANLTTTISWGGAYDANGNAGSTHGLIAQDIAGDPVTKFGTTGSWTYTTIPGDASLDGIVDGGDLNLIGSNWMQPNRHWGQGNFDLSELVDGGDLNLIGSNWMQTAPGLSGGGGLTLALAPANVPEPATTTLGVIAALAGVIVSKRRYSAS